MSRLTRARRDDALSFPRVSGDEPAGSNEVFFVGRFSPRERG